MSLLELERVGKSYGHGGRVALQDVSFVVEPGEMVVVWGERQSGRSTLLRVAAGVESPDTGTVRFEGIDLARSGGTTLGVGIGYCRREFRRDRGPTVLDQLVTGQFARRVSQHTARKRAWRALERAGAERCATLMPAELKVEEVVRVAVARALTSEPRLVVIDEPTIGVGPLERDSILRLLRSIANDGAAVLASAGDGPGLLGADRVLSLCEGSLRGELAPELRDLAPVANLDRRRQARQGGAGA